MWEIVIYEWRQADKKILYLRETLIYKSIDIKEQWLPML